jgi:hypothetical protein
VPFVSRKGAKENKRAALDLNLINALGQVILIGGANPFSIFAPLRETNGAGVNLQRR